MESLVLLLQCMVHQARRFWKLLQLVGHQGLGLGQRRMAALNALVHLLHGRLVVRTTAGTAPEHEALHFPDVLSLQTLHHGIHRFLDLELLCHGNPVLYRTCAHVDRFGTCQLSFHLNGLISSLQILFTSSPPLFPDPGWLCLTSPL
ncbi:hypothetical protein TREES_T100018023 [Tupaia chinensis]|uniref:Uncharacterized protein n=1 Tax=Tupaia chinensis TaxID=246437 RepID=L9JD86_TUPCH|nr:hypothetical protein TREES_T100018023 [Tupaia chinensis]